MEAEVSAGNGEMNSTHGTEVDAQMRTNVAHIFAIGDIDYLSWVKHS